MPVAACKQYDPEWWFPISEKEALNDLTAVAVCWNCQVRQECLAWAQERGILYGTWGGYNQWERLRMLRTRGDQNEGHQDLAAQMAEV